MLTMTKVGVFIKVFNFLAAILQKTRTIIDDKVADLPPFTESTDLVGRTT